MKAALVIGISVGQAALPTCAAIDLAVLAAVRRKWVWMAAAALVAAALKPNDALVLAGAVRERLVAYGLFHEIIQWKLRMFVPTDESGPAILEKLISKYPIERIADKASASS